MAPVQFPHFNLADEVKCRRGQLDLSNLIPTPPGEPWNLEDDKSRVGCDNRGQPIFMVIRHLLTEQGHVSLLFHLVHW
jgi:hypothetical protein